MIRMIQSKIFVFIITEDRLDDDKNESEQDVQLDHIAGLTRFFGETALSWSTRVKRRRSPLLSGRVDFIMTEMNQKKIFD